MFVVAGVREAGEDMPTEYSILQNYPNPFNPSTHITFAIPKASRATLAIVDALGRVQAVLVDCEKTPGTYSVSWNASRFPSGIYFCQLRARPTDAARVEEHEETRRMILLK